MSERFEPRYRVRFPRGGVWGAVCLAAGLWAVPAWGQGSCTHWPMGYWVDRGDIERVRTCIDEGYDVNEVGVGDTPLTRAVHGGHLEIARLLLDHGANPDFQGSFALSSLMMAAADGQGEMVNLLLEEDATVDLVDVYGQTALYKAAAAGHTSIVERLLAAGAAVDPYSEPGDRSGLRTPLHAAAAGGHTAVVQRLLAAGAAVDGVNSACETALFQAALHGHGATVDVLLRAGAASNLIDRSFERQELTAERIAELQGHGQIAALLRERGKILQKSPHEHCDVRVMDPYKVDAEGAISLRMRDEAGSDLLFDVRPDGALRVAGQLSSGTEAFYSLSLVALDTATGEAEHDFLISHSQTEPYLAPNLEAPTLETILLYARALTEAGLVALAGDLDLPPNQAREPVILNLYPEEPSPGKVVTLQGVFPQEGDLAFVLVEPDPILPPEDWRRFPVAIENRTEQRVEIRLPQALFPKDYELEMSYRGRVVGEENSELDVKFPDYEPSALQRVPERLVADTYERLLGFQAMREALRFGHILSRREGAMRYVLYSREAELEQQGSRESYRWLVLLDGKFLGDGDRVRLEVKLALLTSTEADNALEDFAVYRDRMIPILRVEIDDSGGGRSYTTQVLHPELGEVVGVRWDEATNTVTLNNVLGFDLPEEGLRPYFDAENEAVGLLLERGEQRVELEANKEGLQVNHRQRVVRTVDGRRQTFEVTQRQEGDLLFTELRGNFDFGRGEDGEVLGSLDTRLRFDDRFRDPGEPLVDFSGTVELSYRQALRLSLQADAREGRLDGLASRLQYSRDETSLGAELSWKREAGQRRRWHVGAGVSTQFANGDVELKAGVEGDLVRQRGNLHSLEIIGKLEVQWRNLVNAQFGAEGRYFRQFGDRPRQSWSIKGFGGVEFLSSEIRIFGFYTREDGEGTSAAGVEIDAGGIIQGGLELLDLSEPIEIPLFKSGGG